MFRETEVENGRVRGIACGWPSITVYYGIPYAKPPVGSLRWRAPEPAEHWEGTRDCARPSGRCYQLGVGKGSFYEKEFYPVEEPMSEDCLYLNVWTPAKSRDEKLPVIFWIHGGAFMTGYGHSAHFDGEPFARQGVILVTINYRLNIFGWMVSPELDAENDRGVSGNYGLLDQIAALRWVKRNIAAFGGDPENITLAGQSAGAASVQALLCSKLTKGLYQKAVMQSGGGPLPIMDMSFRTLAETEKATSLKALGVSSIAEARALSGEELCARWKAAMISGQGQTGLSDRSPVVDGYVLERTCELAIAKGETPAVPILIGYTGHEGIPIARNRKHLEEIVSRCFGAAGEQYLALCPEDGEAFRDYQDKMTTETARAAAEAYALLRERQGKGETYVYALERQLPGDAMGPFHAADLWYVFRTLTRSWRPWEPADYMLAYACSTYWAEFAKHGTPNGSRKPALPAWKPFTADAPYTMKLDAVSGMVQQPENMRVSRWREALLQLAEIREKMGGKA